MRVAVVAASVPADTPPTPSAQCTHSAYRQCHCAIQPASRSGSPPDSPGVAASPCTAHTPSFTHPPRPQSPPNLSASFSLHRRRRVRPHCSSPCGALSRARRRVLVTGTREKRPWWVAAAGHGGAAGDAASTPPLLYPRRST